MSAIHAFRCYVMLTNSPIGEQRCRSDCHKRDVVTRTLLAHVKWNRIHEKRREREMRCNNNQKSCSTRVTCHVQTRWSKQEPKQREEIQESQSLVLRILCEIHFWLRDRSSSCCWRRSLFISSNCSCTFKRDDRLLRFIDVLGFEGCIPENNHSDQTTVH